VDLYVRLLTKFAEMLPDWQAQFQESVLHQDWSRVQRSAHSLRGMAGTLGAGRLSELASGLEAQLKAGGDVSLLGEWIDRLNAEIRQLSPYLQQLKVRLGQGD